MVRKSQLAELARTLMKDLGPGFSLVQAESVIRKSVLEHVQDSATNKAQFDVIEDSKPFQFDDYDIIKLGSAETKAFNQLSVLAQL